MEITFDLVTEDAVVAPDPTPKKVLLSLLAETLSLEPAYLPIAVFPSPATAWTSALYPTAVLAWPVVKLERACRPTAVFCVPVVLS